MNHSKISGKSLSPSEVVRMTIQAILGDITKMEVDAIVNAANSSLLGGGGVDGAIHKAAGKELLAECRRLNGCKTGEAKLTNGYQLPAKFVIHTVGPVWNGGARQEEAALRSCYLNCLRIAQGNNLRSIAFPCISTGRYRFPIDRAAQIAIETVTGFLQDYTGIETVYFVCYDAQCYDEYMKILIMH